MHVDVETAAVIVINCKILRFETARKADNLTAICEPIV
jgi:hypothetical protein